MLITNPKFHDHATNFNSEEFKPFRESTLECFGTLENYVEFFTPKKLFDGIYETNSSNIHINLVDSENYKDYPNLDAFGEYLNSYGVCDNYQQILEKYPFLQTSERKFLIFIESIIRAEQPASGGWRWHKWGKYIGTHKITQEYLYDEKNIDQVMFFNIVEQVDAN